MTFLRWLVELVSPSEPDFRSAKTVKLPRPRPAVRPAAPSPVLVVTIPRAGRLGFKRAQLRQRLIESLARRGRDAR